MYSDPEDYDYVKYGKAVKLERLRQGIMLLDFAFLLKLPVDEIYVQSVENGEVQPSLGFVEKVNQILGIQLCSFKVDTDSSDDVIIGTTDHVNASDIMAFNVIKLSDYKKTLDDA